MSGVSGSGNVGGIGPKAGGVQPATGTVGEAISRGQTRKPPTTPISSISIPSSESLREKTPLLMEAKAMSVFATKSMMAEGRIPMNQMAPAMAGVGGLFFGVNFPIAIFNTYSLVKNWSEHGEHMRLMIGASSIGGYLLAGAGTALLLANVPQLSKLIGMKASMQAAHYAFILGPIGMGIFSVVNLAMGAISTKNAYNYHQKAREVQKQLETEKDPMIKSILEQQVQKNKTARNFEVVKAIGAFFVAVGIGLGAAVMGGLVGAMLVSPLGWAAVGLVGAGFVISIGVLAARNMHASKEERKKNEQVADQLLAKQDTARLKQMQNLEDEDFMAEIEPGKWNGFERKEILTETGWPRNPTVLEIIRQRIAET